ncbi:choline ABC transporter substrate-binding protein [Pseudooceanicola nanhaiensis]|uniref:choline ABC transporter substrate-binding protein n=1 Tax=Pseudooceanicola nanhaiensis TaxID=375761 RepID=UPI001CD54506|nr:choline ABC transporter substrate-binding protein [Pseudooceanicola nanhaiensis]MCA0920349.1 choline ABC transporter substrate-binding protein [Pseudooceanicola nanhaiensis]
MTKVLFTAASLTALLSAGAAQAQCDTVRMAEPGWTDLALTTGIASVLLEAMGYETDSKVLGIPVIYESMKRGDLDLFLGYWDPAMTQYYAPYEADGSVTTVSQNLEGAKYTFAVPKYVYDAGVHDIADLAKFPEEFGEKIYGIEPGSNELMLAIVADEAFGLDGWDVVESSEQGMLAQVANAVRRDEWIVFNGWAPHPMNTRFEMEYLTGGDAYYGPNFGGATVHTQVRAGYLDACPNIGKLATQLAFDVDLESEGMGYILTDGDDAEAAAEKVIKAHPDLLEGWLDGVTTKDGAPALDAVKAELGL